MNDKLTNEELTQAFRDAKAALDHMRRREFPRDSRENLEKAAGAKIQIDRVEWAREGEVRVVLSLRVDLGAGKGTQAPLKVPKPHSSQGEMRVSLQLDKGECAAETIHEKWNEAQPKLLGCLRALLAVQSPVLASAP